MADNDHSLTIGSDHSLTTTHPVQDRVGCDFDGYTTQDWAAADPATWLFTWHPGDDGQPAGYWNGTRTG